MSGDLLSVVLAWADVDSSLSEEAKLLVLAALQSDDDLAVALDTTRRPPHPAEGAEPLKPAVRAFLASIAVEGFRGIGDQATLNLNPAPGLTVIAGRNGCGKSSFAEALEVALTRGSYRWKARKGPGWRESWRNLHQPEKATITVELAEEGQGRTTVAASWAEGAVLDDVTSWVQRRSVKREAGLQGLGWAGDLELYRPFLSYDELGTLFAEQGKLYEALSSILGLERLEDAQRRLDDIQKPLGAPRTMATAIAKDLKPLLQNLDDDRAEAAYDLLRKRQPDLAAIQALATGSSPVDDASLLARLRRIADLTAPDRSAFDAAVTHYQQAADALAKVNHGVAAAATRRLDLLTRALQMHQEDGDGPCPVCEQGRLTDEWAVKVRAELAADQAATHACTNAQRELDNAARALTALTTPVPPLLIQATDDTLLGNVDVKGAVAAWQGWARLTTPAELAVKGAAALDALLTALTPVTAQADRELEQRQDAWQPLALRLGEWLTAATEAQAVQAKLDDSKAAAAWLKAHSHELRNERLRPLADRSRRIWALLRQESNVDLGAITLTGAKNQRKVELGAAVDGIDAGALGVMSQGELNALALSLFLPKATSPDSPFGFVVIDDPVQAMDPSKVDGLAKVLAEVAEDRQVIVLTHDDRLPEAVRRLDIPATLLEVTRDNGSAVTVTQISDPAERYISDARAVATDKQIPDDVARQVIPQLCRMGVEARCRDLYFGRELRAGTTRDMVERGWAQANTTRRRVALVVNSDPAENLDRWLSAKPRRKTALGICTAAPHKGMHGHLHSGIDDVESVLADLLAARRR